ncbi:PP2C family protein-serine/threonine phosphatase [Buchananella hordeovulneris]|uniref:PP2C family protein-serine/threonine phosphatase n=1 Tax=Buchananella hordeovulneris TaxID=52770 RepID=UPI003F659EFB
MSVFLNYAARSDVGLVRRSNQDSGYAGPHLAVLADGMGGPAGGDIASSVAVAHLAPLDSDAHGADDLLDLLRQAIGSAHAELVERSRLDPELEGLGTTCIALLRAGTKIGMVHIGDSRAYLLRDGRFTQVTTDHTFVNYLVQTGRLSEEQAARHPQRSVLLRVLGDADEPVELDESVREAHPGDRWLLCSDGLSGVVSAETIAEVVGAEADPGSCADKLVDLALRAGAPDNVTVVVVDVLDDANSNPVNLPTSAQVVGSAATDRLAATRGGGSAAARAHALAAPTAPPEEVDEEPSHPPQRPHRKRNIILSLLLSLALFLGVGGWLAYRWAHSHYYVQASDGTIRIYRGIPQQLGPLKFSHEYEDTGLRLSSLPQARQDNLRTPVTRSSLEEIRSFVAGLKAEAQQREQRRVIPLPLPGQTVSPSASPTASPSASPTASPPPSAVPSPTSTIPPPATAVPTPVPSLSPGAQLNRITSHSLPSAPATPTPTSPAPRS